MVVALALATLVSVLVIMQMVSAFEVHLTVCQMHFFFKSYVYYQAKECPSIVIYSK